MIKAGVGKSNNPDAIKKAEKIKLQGKIAELSEIS